MVIKTLATFLASASFAALTAGAGVAQTVYVPEGSGNSVLVVDGATGRTLNRIEGVEAVHGLGGASGVPVLVAGSFAEVDRADAMAADRPAGVSADDHAVHHAKPEGRKGPANAALSMLSVIDVETGEILRRIEVPGAVHHTAVSPDGRFAVATHPAGDGISVVDLHDNETVAFVPTGAMPNYAVFGRDPETVYVSNTGNGTVSEVDLTRGIVRRNLVAGETPEHIVLDPSANALYVADAEAGRVLELSLDSGETERSFDIGGEIHGLGLTADGGRLVVAGRGEDKLVSIDLSDGTTTAAPLGPEPYHLTPVPGTGVLFVSSRAEPKVWVVDAATLKPTSDFAVQGEGHQMVALP
ncbi:YncE family protein [Tranquillimonas alkanivorans]|uniref:DNA-binding beta-propeller fold protein YncE n=1 Tax=Tranquillimonas alkanivorans TaxID=441119 RepID=A0A1I5V507_9RHOB|nr:YncE family protein [Tranquillimonas alkanivorans]SFQ02633.1 DNA-binding beta-propeller fold protein YncE [Tranquillimonas alkanivorans]